LQTIRLIISAWDGRCS